MPVARMVARSPKNPRKTLADTLSAIAWSNAVAIDSGLSPYQIEVRFMPECVKRVDGQLIRPRLMDRYAKGELTPKLGKQKCGGLQLVNKIDSSYRGTARWLRHPLWDLMQPKDYSLSELHGLMLKLEGKLARFFFVDLGRSEGAYVRNYNVQPKVVRNLWKHASLDTFALLLGLLREAEIRTDMPSHHCSCHAMLRMLPEIAKLSPIKPIAGRIFDYLEHRFFKVIYTDPGGSEMHFSNSWREMHPNVAKEYPQGNSGEYEASERRYILNPIKHKS